MTNALFAPRKHKLPEWYVASNGQQRLHGRWNMQRVGEFIVANPTWHTLDDLARIVYGSTSKKRRENVREHIPAQRRYMLNDLQQPIVTEYGQRGRIARIKLFNQADENDRVKLKMELDRAYDRKEVSQQRYDALVSIFLLAAPTT